MNVFRYCILLFITVISLVSIVSAPATTSGSDNSVIFTDNHTHTITGIYDQNDDTSIVYGGWVKDTVTSIPGGAVMRFEWFDPSGDRRQKTTVRQVVKDGVDYVDILSDVDSAGLWSVVVTEARMGEKNWRSEGTFTVANLPEYSFGSFISLFFTGVLYFLMRRVIGPVNVN